MFQISQNFKEHTPISKNGIAKIRTLIAFYKLKANKIFSLILLVSSIIHVPASLIGIAASIYYKRHFSIEQSSSNPLRLIYDVLKYSYHHKYPERRSSMTYWENDIPSRIDLGKHKYGGPFTYEQIESVKTVLRLLLLMISLFGFHLSGEGYSLSTYIMNTAGCPTIAPYLVQVECCYYTDC